MNRLISVLALLSFAMPVFAQSASSEPAAPQKPERVTSIPKTDLLSPFSKLDIDGPMNVHLKRIGDGEDTKIVYDTKGYISSKFKASVNKEGVLRVEERLDQKRDDVTDVTIYYNSLSEIKVARATGDFRRCARMPHPRHVGYGRSDSYDRRAGTRHIRRVYGQEFARHRRFVAILQTQCFDRQGRGVETRYRIVHRRCVAWRGCPRQGVRTFGGGNLDIGEGVLSRQSRNRARQNVAIRRRNNIGGLIAGGNRCALFCQR